MELARITNPDDYLPFIEGAKDLDDLTIKVQKIIEQWGFSSFSYWLKQSPNGTHEPIAFATYPAEYSKHYMKNTEITCARCTEKLSLSFQLTRRV